MKKLFYLSHISFADNDKMILPHLSKLFKITYCTVIPLNSSKQSDSVLFEFCKRERIIFLPIKLKQRQRNIKINSQFLKIIKLINFLDPDIIYSFSFDNPVLFLIPFLLDKSKTIIFLHDVEFHSSTSNSLFMAIGRKFSIFHFKYFHVFSENQKNKFKLSYRTKKVFSIPLFPIHLGNSINIGEKGLIKRFLFFGKIHPYKGLEILIDAANELSINHYHFELIIAGTCTNWNSTYEPLVKTSKIIKNIKFIPDEEVSNLFLTSHFLILPYRDATQSGPLMLAYNYNLPVIASNIEPFKEFVKEDINGYYFNSGDSRSLSAVMEKVILQDPKDYKLLETKMKEYVTSEFSNAKLMKVYKEMFFNFSESK